MSGRCLRRSQPPQAMGDIEQPTADSTRLGCHGDRRHLVLIVLLAEEADAAHAREALGLLGGERSPIQLPS
jgi:hypothetical protein